MATPRVKKTKTPDSVDNTNPTENAGVPAVTTTTPTTDSSAAAAEFPIVAQAEVTASVSADKKEEVKGGAKEEVKVKKPEVLRQPAEIKYAEELAFLSSIDTGKRPFSWKLSPQMIRTFILGATAADKIARPIAQKFFGDPALVERAIVTLASDRGLLLIGDPGTGKSWLAELLAAAICGCSTHTVQGTAGTTEDQIKYSWNVALVIAKGQSRDSLIPSPIMIAMQHAATGRIEELTRCTSDVQDALISILSEKYITIPELSGDNVVFARPGFNIIATANSRDRGVNDLSTALKRRFNFVTIPTVTNRKSEKEIVMFRTRELLARNQFEVELPPALLDILLQTFADLRDAQTAATSDDQRLESSLSTAEQIGVLEDAVLHSQFFGQTALSAQNLAKALIGTLARRIPEDVSIMNKFWHSVVEKRAKEKKGDWDEYLEGGKQAMCLLK